MTDMPDRIAVSLGLIEINRSTLGAIIDAKRQAETASVEINFTRKGASEECGCPEEEWTINGIETLIHIEPDGSGEMFFDAGDWQAEVVAAATCIRGLRRAAIKWVAALEEEAP